MNSEGLDEATICFDIGDSLIKRTKIGLKKGVEEVTTRKEPTELLVDIQDDGKTKEKSVVPEVVSRQDGAESRTRVGRS